MHRRGGLNTDTAAADKPCDTYLLGEWPDGGMAFALDVSPLGERASEVVCGVSVDATPLDMRQALMVAGDHDIAIAGQAVALSQWHQAHQFCPQCGSPTRAVNFGTRRQCTSPTPHKQYPRTDPVVIMLVESPDGGQALLARSHKIRNNMQTCLAGFIDQCESIEEAVKREVFEEVGLHVDSVSVVGSQPWPIGRGGSCELMIAAVARATHMDFKINTVEMQEAAWYDRAVLREAVAEAKELSQHPYATNVVPERGFFIPPPIAIAHHLIQRWADGTPACKL